MNYHDADLITKSRNAFVSNRALTLADLKAQIEAGSEGKTAQRDMLSALNRVEKLFGKPLDTVQATPKGIRDLFSGQPATALGVSDKTFSNIRSGVARALKTYGESAVPLTRRIPPSPEWRRLLDGINEPQWRYGLYRLACYCTVMKIAPEEVEGDTLKGLHAAMEGEEVAKNPKTVLKNTISTWNRCRRNIPGWPEITLSSPFSKEPWTLPLDAFPESLQVEIADWVEAMRNPDLFDLGAISKPLRPATIDSRILIFRQFGTILVRSDAINLDELTSLSVMLSPENFRAGLRAYYEHLGSKKTQRLHNLANTLRLVAKHHCKFSDVDLGTLKDLCQRMDPGTGRQMTEKNRERLRQFDDPRNVAKLLNFPEQQVEKAKKEKKPLRAAKRMERAVAVEILIHCGLRLKTLRTLELTDFHWSAESKCILFVIPAKTKMDNRPLEFELGADTVVLLRTFLEKHRSLLPGSEGPYLFPGKNGGARSKNAMYEAITSSLKRETGLEVNPHLVRHIIGKIAVERDPGSYLAVSRVLGHSTLDTTMTHYLGSETKAAGKHLDGILTKAKKGKS